MGLISYLLQIEWIVGLSGEESGIYKLFPLVIRKPNNPLLAVVTPEPITALWLNRAQRDTALKVCSPYENRVTLIRHLVLGRLLLNLVIVVLYVIYQQIYIVFILRDCGFSAVIVQVVVIL